MDIRKVIDRIEDTAPLEGAMEWDKSGVQIASAGRDIGLLAVALDPTPSTVSRALDWGADLLLTHHPLSMSPRFPDADDEYLAILKGFLCAESWLYAAHTSLDANPDGPVGWLARELALQHTRVLEPTLETEARTLGLGCAGDLPAPLDWDGFCAALGSATGLVHWRDCGPRPDTVRRVAYCTGSGSSLERAAVASGADVFITGDMKYHPALDASVCIIDVGHFSLEEEMMRRFALQLQDDAALNELEIHFFPGQDPFRHVAPPQKAD